MDRQQIINEILKEQLIEKCSTTFISYITEEYRKDYILEMYLQLLLIDEDKLFDLYSTKKLNYYMLTICKNNAVNPKSDFWKMHKSRLKLITIDENLADKI